MKLPPPAHDDAKRSCGRASGWRRSSPAKVRGVRGAAELADCLASAEQGKGYGTRRHSEPLAERPAERPPSHGGPRERHANASSTTRVHPRIRPRRQIAAGCGPFASYETH
jgi:hypothetical protein